MKTKTSFYLFPSLSFTNQLTLTILFNTLIAIIVNLIIGRNGFIGFVGNFITSQIIGLTILVTLHSVYSIRFRYTNKTQMTFMVTFVAIVIGSLLGVTVFYYSLLTATGITFSNFSMSSFLEILMNVSYGIIFSSVIISFFMNREKLSKAINEVQKHKLSLLDNERRMLESELKLLQSQIEPHFLFNTLSNVIGLIDKNPQRGKSMLESLTHYLRSTLEYTRQESATLADELSMISAYLAIFKERMGKRLQYKIAVDNSLYTQSFPPMLLQPLVENAIKHGLESRLQGGYVHILGERIGDKILLIVEDSGEGLQQEVGNGVGLANVQQRLKALFADRASIVLEDNKPSGLRVAIEIPYEKN